MTGFILHDGTVPVPGQSSNRATAKTCERNEHHILLISGFCQYGTKNGKKNKTEPLRTHHQNPMHLTLGQAAKETGKSKSVISSAIKSGRLSASRSDTGSWQIDPAELFRVFSKQNAQNPEKEQNRTPENTQQNMLLEREIEFLHERLREKDGVIDDLRQDRDHWRQQATALLTDGRSHERPGFWSRLFRKP
jgi:hypothetical protein